MHIIYSLLILLGIIFVIAHFMTTSREMDSMGLLGSNKYQDFLTKKKAPSRGAITAIPPPSDGIRDFEVESLIKSGKLVQARRLLGERMEEAKMAPVGSAAKMARITHYIAFMNEETSYQDF